MRFIELHWHGERILVNITSIVMMTSCEDGTEITTINGQFIVTETIDEIKTRIFG